MHHHTIRVMPFARRGGSLKAMSSMIALPAPRLASANGSAAAVLYPLHRLAALLGQIYLVTIVSLLVANLGRSAKPAAEGQETR
jgi:hypothetical protein